MAYVDRCKILSDMAEGLLRRTYVAVRLLQNEKPPSCLVDPELQKVRAKLEKSFPEVPDLAKVPGAEKFVAQAADTIMALSDYEDVIIGLVEFGRVAEPLLLEIPQQNITDIKLERCQPVLIAYFDLFVAYMRVMLVFTSFADRRLVYAIYSAAYSSQNSGRKCSSWNDACILLSFTENIQRSFINSFSKVAPLLKALLLTLKAPISYSYSIAACDRLREQFVLNPTNQGSAISLPSKLDLSSSCSLSAYSEIANCSKYADYVIFTHLACPSLLFVPDSLQLFEQVASGVLFVGIFRDLTLSVHDEFDNLSQQFPGTQDAVSVPKGFKFKTSLKAIAKAAIEGSALRMRYRRSYITAELQNLKGILTASPGLLAPKFPVVVAAAAFAKEEALAYFRHVNSNQQAAIRKDCRKDYLAAEFESPDITTLLYELGCITDLVKKHGSIVRSYYSEFLAVNDVKALTSICRDCTSDIPAFQPLLSAFVTDLQAVNVSAVSTSPWQPESVEATAEPSPAYPDLRPFRLNFDRLVAMLVSKKYGVAGPSFDALCDRMRAVSERSRYVDSLKYLIRDSFEAYECWWFRSQSWKAFNDAITHIGTSPFPLHSLVYFRHFQFSEMNVHPDCLVEKALLAQVTLKAANGFINCLSTHVLKQLKGLWEYLTLLDAQVLPIEAARRIERNQAARRKDPNAVAEPGPGFESEGGANRKTIAKYVSIRSNLTQLLSATANLGVFSIHTREFNLSVLCRELISSFLDNAMHRLFFDSEEDVVTSRPSKSVLRFVAGCRAMQIALNYLGSNFQVTLRNLLFRECVDMSIPPPGVPIPVGSTEPSHSLVWRLGGWFCQVAENIASPSSGVVWSPNKKVFVALKAGGQQAAELETYLSPEDLRQLCSVIGSQGVRVIDSMLVQQIASKLQRVTSFLSEHKTILVEFEAEYSLNIRSVLKLKAVSDLENSLTSMGVLLSMRELIHNAMDENMFVLSPNLPNVVSSVAQTLQPWLHPALCTPVFSLLTDLGSVTTPDLALLTSLSDEIGATSRELLGLFPVAAAAIFASDRWDSATYLTETEAFDKNQHMTTVAVCSLMTCFYVSSPKSAAASSSSSSSSSSAAAAAAGALAARTDYHNMCEKYIKISSQLLLMLRSVESASYPHRPLRGMCMLLEHFVKACPLVDRSDLEAYLPYSLLHAGLMDLSLGRHREADTLKSFAHFSRHATAGAAGAGGSQGVDAAGQMIQEALSQSTTSATAAAAAASEA